VAPPARATSMNKSEVDVEKAIPSERLSFIYDLIAKSGPEPHEFLEVKSQARQRLFTI
jgi:hypothetical protein